MCDSSAGESGGDASHGPESGRVSDAADSGHGKCYILSADWFSLREVHVGTMTQICLNGVTIHGVGGERAPWPSWLVASEHLAQAVRLLTSSALVLSSSVRQSGLY